jgi:hypothetical protein
MRKRKEDACEEHYGVNRDMGTNGEKRYECEAKVGKCRFEIWSGRGEDVQHTVERA